MEDFDEDMMADMEDEEEILEGDTDGFDEEPSEV